MACRRGGEHDSTRSGEGHRGQAAGRLQRRGEGLGVPSRTGGRSDGSAGSDGLPQAAHTARVRSFSLQDGLGTDATSLDQQGRNGCLCSDRIVGNFQQKRDQPQEDVRLPGIPRQSPQRGSAGV